MPTPGQKAANFNSTAGLIWGGEQVYVLRDQRVFDSTSVDAGNSPTSILRPGLLAGVLDATGECVDWDPDAIDGSQNLIGVLEHELKMTDEFANARDEFPGVLLRAPVKASALLIEGAALVGHAAEYLARVQLGRLGFVLDDDPQGYLSAQNQRSQSKVTNYTIVAADQGSRFDLATADATLTLPAIQAGLEFEVRRLSDHETVVASAEGDNMVVGNDLSADSVTYTTASEQIGAWIKIKAQYLNIAGTQTLKWVPELARAPFGTGGTGAMTIAIAT